LRNIPARSLDSLRFEPEDAVQIMTVHSTRGVLILMHVFGADFSGARNPSKGIYYAEGIFKGSTLHIERVVHCDDCLDQ